MSEDPQGVVAATLTAGDVPMEFLVAWSEMLQYDASMGRGHIAAGGTLVLQSGPRIAEARSQLVDKFLEDETLAGAEWLLMIDSDMRFQRDLVDRLVEVADPTEAPIMGGLCFAGGRSMEPYPTIYREVLADRDGEATFVGVEPVRDYPRDALVRVGATGAACLMMHRRVLTAMTQPWPKGYGTLQDGTRNPYPWFIEGLTGPGGEPFGEDVAFCRRLAHMAVPIHVHTGIKLGHVKRYSLDEAYFDRWMETQPKPEPLMNRAERRRQAREGLRAS